jgi:hypothetical protein
MIFSENIPRSWFPDLGTLSCGRAWTALVKVIFNFFNFLNYEFLAISMGI